MPEVIDAWYDSGSMPFAQWGYPHRESKELFEQRYPAQFICEAIDQTRGWFYTLMAVGTLVFDQSSYENVVCLGHILAEDGRKMSKHLGNILEPIPLMDQHGADAVRWFMAASGSPWAARRVGPQRAPGGRPQDAAHLLEHGRLPGPVRPARRTGRRPRRPGAGRPPGARPLAALASCTGWSGEVDEAHGGVRHPARRAGCSSAFVDDLSNWYVRRSRRRFWHGDAGRAARPCTRRCDVLTRLLAPLMPFITERVWQDLVRPVTPGRCRSRCTWPRGRTPTRR